MKMAQYHISHSVLGICCTPPHNGLGKAAGENNLANNSGV